MLSVGMLAMTAGCAFQFGLAYLIPTLRAQGLSLAEAGLLAAAPTAGLLRRVCGDRGSTRPPGSPLPADRREAEGVQCVDQRQLDTADQSTGTELAHVEHEVADELAGTVVGGMSAAVGLHQGDVLGRVGQLAARRPGGVGDHRRVREQEEPVGGEALFALLNPASACAAA
ncbi:hypothetical protein [Nonomuraea sp. B19D2]|uniref:hypothetical protein n=1 Tax=Nonomuraea sp. B19D2 TaxID=3159561 RepID=UPI0032DB9105